MIMVACAIALSPAPRLSYALVVIAFAYFIAIHGELVNFLYDFNLDLRNPRMKGYAHITGTIKRSSLKTAAYLFLLMALATGYALLDIRKDVLLLIIMAIHCAHSYSAPPLRLKRYWWGGIITYTTYTAVVLLISTSLLGAEPTAAGKTALAFWLGSLSVWTLTSIPDQAYDKKEGIETPAIKFGAEKCVNLYMLLALLSITISAAISIVPANNLYVGLPFLIPASIGMIAYSRMKKEVKSEIRKQTFNLAILPYRYNMALVTLSYFLF